MPAICCSTCRSADKNATDAAFAKAHAVAEVTIVNPRVITNLHGNPRGGLRIRRQARSSHADRRSQGSHRLREIIGGMVTEDAAGKDAG